VLGESSRGAAALDRGDKEGYERQKADDEHDDEAGRDTCRSAAHARRLRGRRVQRLIVELGDELVANSWHGLDELRPVSAVVERFADFPNPLCQRVLYDVYVRPDGPEKLILRDEKQLFFSSARPGNVGQVDIWVVERSTNSAPWGTPINLDTLNSPFFQAMPTFRANGKEVCFMSFRPTGFGNLDVWCAVRLE
jgi:hypothetical protein